MKFIQNVTDSVCKQDSSVGAVIIIVASLAAACFMAWLFSRD